MRTNHCFEGYWPIPCSCPVELQDVSDPAAARALVEQALRKEAS